MAAGRARPDAGAAVSGSDAPAPAPANDAAGDLAALAQAGERRALHALARLAEDVTRLGRALDARMQNAEARVAGELGAVRRDLAALEEMTARGLAALEAGQAEAAAALRGEIAQAVDQLCARIAAAEHVAVEAAARLGRRLDALDAQARAGEARMAEALDARLADQQVRSNQQLAGLQTEVAHRDAAMRAEVEARLRKRSSFTFATGAVLVLAGAAGATSLAAVAWQLAQPHRPNAAPQAAPGAVVRVPLPLRPTLPAIPPAPLADTSAPPREGEPGGARPGGARPGAPRAGEDFAALSQAVDRGDAAALARARMLAEGGAPLAQLLIAKLYEEGRAGLPRDVAKAREWTARAAAGGERAAMHNLAVYLMNGEGGPPDAPAAARWFRKAADAGVVDAQFNLAVLYENGRGVAKNLGEAYRWYSIAANAGDGLARARAVALEDRLTRQERAAAREEVRSFTPGRAEPRLAVPVAPPAETVAQSQQMLAREGYFIGATDGSDSDAYRAAVAAYLEDHPQARPALPAP